MKAFSSGSLVSCIRLLVLVCLFSGISGVTSVQAQACGSIHSAKKYLQGRSFAAIFVPEGYQNDVFECLMTKAKDTWQSSCPNNTITEFHVVRGQRSDGNTTDVAVTNLGSLDSAVWMHETNTINFDSSSFVHTWVCDDPYSVNVAIHELGHALGLDDEECVPSDPTSRPMMEEIDIYNPTDPPYRVQAEHCEAVELANRCADSPPVLLLLSP